MNPLIAQVSGISEASENAVAGFIAIQSDGRIFSGPAHQGVYVLRDANFLKRIAPVDSVIVPVRLVVPHDPSIQPHVLSQALRGAS